MKYGMHHVIKHRSVDRPHVWWCLPYRNSVESACVWICVGPFYDVYMITELHHDIRWLCLHQAVPHDAINTCLKPPLVIISPRKCFTKALLY